MALSTVAFLLFGIPAAHALPLGYDSSCGGCARVGWSAPEGSPESFATEIREFQRSWERLREDADEMRAWARDANVRAADALTELAALRLKVPGAARAGYDRCLLAGSRMESGAPACFRRARANLEPKGRDLADEIALTALRMVYYGAKGAHVAAYCRIHAKNAPCAQCDAAGCVIDPKLRDEPRVADLKRLLANAYEFRPLLPGEKAAAPPAAR